MKIVRFHEKGVPEVLKLEEHPIPAPGAGEALIRVEAAGVNYGDTLRRSGRHYPIPTPLPYAPGTQTIGMIERLGEGVDKALLGQRVFAAVPGGGYADYAIGSAATAYPCPAELPAAQAIAIMDQGATAALVLKVAGRIRAGDTVLVPAAAGGVGSLAVQLARIYGASRVIGLASTAAKRTLVVSLGADTAIDYTQDNWSQAVLDANGDKGVDLALEMTGGAVFHETLKAVKPQFGRVCDLWKCQRRGSQFQSPHTGRPQHEYNGIHASRGAGVGARYSGRIGALRARWSLEARNRGDLSLSGSRDSAPRARDPRIERCARAGALV